MKGTIRTALAISATVGALSPNVLWAREGDECPTGYYCDKEAAFNVMVPDGYEAKKRPVQNIAAQLTRRGESRGPNCPIVSEIHLSSQLWYNIQLPNPKEFWKLIFTPPYFSDPESDDGKKAPQIDLLFYKDADGKDHVPDEFDVPGNLVSLVEVKFRVNGKGPRLKAYQAFYWIPTWDEPSSESIKHAWSRAYFVNCTAIDEKGASPNFTSELPKFRDVFSRFEARSCYTDAATGKPACFDENGDLHLSQRSQDRFSPQAAGDKSSSLVEFGARAAVMGAQ